MLKNTLSFIIVIFILSGCKSKNAFNYSQNFVKKELSLVPSVEETEKKVAAFIEKEQYDSIVVEGAKAEKLIDNVIVEIRDTPAPDAKDGERFKADIIKYFEFMKSVYTTYREFGSAPNEEERNNVVVKLQKIVANRQGVTNKIQASQRSFATANGFKIK